jgi:muramoyltetrapeptide carboxypeptidase
LNVYTITPSWLIKKRKDFVAGIKGLEKLGLHILNPGFPTRRPSIPAKIRQIHQAFLNPIVELILAQRGGYSSLKLLPYLDFSLIKRNPKTFAGFSDLSILLNVIHEKTALRTLHSPMIINFPSAPAPTVRSFLNALQGFPQRDLFRGAPVEVHRSGIVRGTLKGGNLITLTALIGTEWDIETRGSILFFEDVNQELHEIDRNLTQWILTGKLKNIKGLILGDFRGIHHGQVYQIIAEQLKVGFPVVHCPWIGHGRHNVTLPVGAKVELNTRKKSLILL